MLSTIKNISKGIVKKTRTSFHNPYKKMRISWFRQRVLKNSPERPCYRQRFLDGYVEFKNRAEFFYALDEIFVNEIYRLPPAIAPKIIDCGGNIGMSAIYFKHHFPDAQIIVFEPDNRNYEWLVKNLQLQHCSNVEPRKEAVWVENTSLNFRSEGTMSSKITSADEAHYQNVKAVRLNDFLTEKIYLLKMDIEGAEYQVIKDLKDKLHLVDHLFIEYHGSFSQQNELLQMLQWIADADFTFYIKEAHNVFPHPFYRAIHDKSHYDVQLNIFASRN